ncbi:MAG TPA: [protein-PII] uridylyltransferase [Patescibacteria group bacterium]|nr:[protein-PII] uridylyltransferase [Patescibacteria group bacterium]
MTQSTKSADQKNPALSGAGKKANALSLLVDKFKTEREALFAEISKDVRRKNGGYFHNSLSAQADAALCTLAETVCAGAKSDLPAVVAVGGYGRNELAPYSDLDVLFVTTGDLTTDGRKMVDGLHQTLWNAGVKLAYSVRTVADCEAAMETDLHFLTSLLEKRLVWGSRKTYAALDSAVKKHLDAAAPATFIAAKLAEQEARHKKLGDSRYQLQPNIKESKGGLRDIQTLLWIANFLYGITTPEGLVEKNVLTAQEAETLQDAVEFFWAVRWHLHLANKRFDDRLAFDIQPEIAARLGYKETELNKRAEHFMKDYFMTAAEVGHLTRIICADLEARSLSAGATAGTKKPALANIVEGFPLTHNRLTVADKTHFRKTPSDIVRIFRASQNSGYDIHPDALRAVRNAVKNADFTQDGEAFRLFLLILLDEKKSEQTLRRLNEAGVLSALLPDFGNIFAHMQYDMYHVYTADEHTIRAVGMMHKLENGELAEQAPLATELFKKIQSRRALYVAMFLHDIAKGTGGKHSEAGAKIARKVCPLLGLAPEETETVIWLVEYHLVMTMAAFKRDLNDPKAIEDFVSYVQSPERLKLLTILTTADIMAVGPDKWNNWKGGLLTELYDKAYEFMSGTPKDRDDNDQFIILQKQARRLVGRNAPTLQYLADYAPKYFWLSFSPETIAGFARSIEKNTGKEATVIRVSPNAAQDFTEVFVFTPDRKGLFATLSGAMAAAGASIGDARIFTLTNGMALDVFQIQDLRGHVYDNSGFLQKTLKAALAGTLDLAQEIAERRRTAPQKGRHFTVQPRVIIDNNASASNTVIEVNGKDRPGFLYDITSALTAEGLQISAAKITTFGSRAVDVFYVKDSFGLKIVHRAKLAGVEKSLMAALVKNQ